MLRTKSSFSVMLVLALSPPPLIAASYDVLHIEDQPLGLAAGAADHDLLVRLLLFLAEHRIMMFGNTGDDARHAFATDSKLAGIIDIDALVEEDFEDLLAFRDEIFLAGACEFYPKAAEFAPLRFFLGCEIFHVHLMPWHVRGSGLKGREHGIWTAAVE